MSIAFETPPRRVPPSQAAPCTWTGPLYKTAQVVVVVAAYAFVTTVLFVL